MRGVLAHVSDRFLVSAFNVHVFTQATRVCTFVFWVSSPFSFDVNRCFLRRACASVRWWGMGSCALELNTKACEAQAVDVCIHVYVCSRIHIDLCAVCCIF
jgi:hypothetical protein